MEQSAVHVSAGIGALRHDQSLSVACGAAPPLFTLAGGKTRPLCVCVCVFVCVCFRRGVPNCTIHWKPVYLQGCIQNFKNTKVN